MGFGLGIGDQRFEIGNGKRFKFGQRHLHSYIYIIESGGHGCGPRTCSTRQRPGHDGPRTFATEPAVLSIAMCHAKTASNWRNLVIVKLSKEILET